MALDLPTGLNPDTGEVDPACPKADVTIALGVPKRGLLAFPGAIGPAVGAWLGIEMVLTGWPVAAAGVVLLSLGVASQWIRRRDTAFEMSGA